MRTLGLVALLAFLASIATVGSVRAQTIFERIIMPGDLIEGHAKLEPKCDNCHSAFSKDVQSKLCRDCHKPESEDVSRKQGFHGRDRNAASAPCKSCHTDHIGRDADTVRLDAETFDHNLTDFPLRGLHRGPECRSCHAPKKKMREAPSNCFACHEADDRHHGRLGKDCKACHSEDGWRKTKPFDHDSTKFKLVGSHEKVACLGCHAGERWKDLPTTCISCHQAQDVHEGRLGPGCKSCHSPKKWDTVKFDHDRETDFPLRGQHRKQKCESCHTANAFEFKLETTCVACHRDDDAHKGELGTNCKKCHQEDGWRRDVVFDHDITRFPLLGLHATAPCEACHTTARFKETPRTCVGCHEKDDSHTGRLGTGCSNCHTPNGWAFWKFNHDSQTDFPLTGAHSGLDCHACHTALVTEKIELSSSCYSCHQNDDIHRGSFGRRCERCHSTQTFSGVRAQR
jgi:hypothetical protein